MLALPVVVGSQNSCAKAGLKPRTPNPPFFVMPGQADPALVPGNSLQGAGKRLEGNFPPPWTWVVQGSWYFRNRTAARQTWIGQKGRGSGVRALVSGQRRRPVPTAGLWGQKPQGAWTAVEGLHNGASANGAGAGSMVRPRRAAHPLGLGANAMGQPGRKRGRADTAGGLGPCGDARSGSGRASPVVF